MQETDDLRPDPAEPEEPRSEDELDWEGDPDDLLSVLVDVSRPSGEPPAAP